jgi:single-strand DNA-binding protein
MGDVQLTVSGWVGSDPEFHNGQAAGGDRVTFRLGSTPRFFDRAQGGYRERETVWLGVKAWRDLAHNVAASVHVGDPVVVVGRLRTQVYTVEGEERRYQELEASSVGHDLTKGTSMFRRTHRSTESGPVESTQQQAATAGSAASEGAEPSADPVRERILEPVARVQAGAA